MIRFSVTGLLINAEAPKKENGLTAFCPSHGCSYSQPLDVLVVGGGNAALCAAITARRAGASVMLLEASPKEFRGGNSRHTRNIRYVHAAKNDFLTGPYTEEECFNDLMGVTKGNTIESMARLVIRNSNNVGYWMMEQGVHFQPAMRGTLRRRQGAHQRLLRYRGEARRQSAL